MLSLILAGLLQASLPMFEENPVPLEAVEVKEGETKVIHLVPTEDPPEAQKLKLDILAGAQIGFATEAKNSYYPFVRIDTSVPLAKSPKAPSLLVGIDLGGAQGAAVGLEDIQSWTTIKVNLGASLYPVEALNIGLWGEFEFSSHLPGDTTPRVKAPRSGYGGVILDRFDQGCLKVGLGMTETLGGGGYLSALKVAGRLELYQAKEGTLKGGQVSIVGEAVLGINVSEYVLAASGGVHDQIWAGLVVGWSSR